MLLHVFTDIGNVAIWAGSALLLVWIVQYTRLGPWWKNMVGRTIVGLVVSILVIFAPSLVALADPAFTGFGTSRWYQWLGIFTVIFVFCVAAAMNATWAYVARRKRIINGEKTP